jgi:hypothetical protein
MNGFEHPGMILLIHETNVRAEMERDRREHLRGEYLPRPRGGGPGSLRIAIGHVLIALARRIAPADAGVPAGARH